MSPKYSTKSATLHLFRAYKQGRNYEEPTSVLFRFDFYG